MFDLAVSPTDPDVVVAVTRYDLRAIGRHGIYRSADGGDTWTLVHQFPQLPMAAGRIIWAPDDGSLVMAAWGTSVAISTDAGVTFQDRFPWGAGSGLAYHVSTHSAPSAGRSIYALGNGQVWLSRNVGVDWTPFPFSPSLQEARPRRPWETRPASW